LSVRFSAGFGVVTRDCHLRALITVLRAPILVTYNENSDVGVHMPIDDRIGKPRERKRTSVFSCWFPNVGKLLK